MSDQGGFDPRYSPEFQRGYEPGSLGRTAEAREDHSPSRVAPMPVAPVPDRVSRPTDEPDQSETPDSGEPVDGADSAELGESGRPAESRPWRNPYLIALAVIGSTLTIIGVSLYRWAVTQMYSGQISGGETTEDARAEWISVQVAWGIAPLLCLAGVMTVIGVGFFLATAWKPGSRGMGGRDDELDG